MEKNTESTEGPPLKEEAIRDSQDLSDLSPEFTDLSPEFMDLPVSSFGEVWGYVIGGREQALRGNYPLSDVVYFGAEIDTYGSLTDVPDRKKLTWFPGRVHLGVACNSSRALTHFVLEKEGAVRKQLIADLLEASRYYDGLQIDFELVPAKDGGNFLSFLTELRAGLSGKMFTIALPARLKTLQDDVYDYRKISPLVDRVLVMAYDEHWSTSAPGPIASMSWCRSVASYSLSVLEPEKLVMGIPFYGRTWGSINPFRAFFFSGIQRIREENHVSSIRRENGIPTFTYEAPLLVTVYYEDQYSLSARMEMYRHMGVGAIGFWSIGQEDPGFWNLLKLE
ncbi:MAG: glycoside hydrolase [Treponema sp.]|nr:glycoside hydrolase [Treponema sp.]